MRTEATNDINDPLNGQKNNVANAMHLLLDALNYATDTQSDIWDFAVEAEQLRDTGLSPN